MGSSKDYLYGWFYGRIKPCVLPVYSSVAEEPKAQDREPLDVYTVTTVMIDQMASIAWSKLGLQPDMMTGTIVKDLNQAKAAIDIVDYLATVIGSQLDEADQRQMHALVRDLKMNYVNKRQEESVGQ